ncbi:MAG: GNAT family N-acetyltransferase [Thermomicrobiales bacterium]
MTFAFRDMTIDDARAIAGWRYEPPYDFYNNEDDLQITGVPAGYVSTYTDGELFGFVCIGLDARVPGCEQDGCYADEALDLGLGMRPDLTGRGYGQTFVQACLDYAMERFMPTTMRLTVATFNERAIRVYERAGFVRGNRCLSPVRGVDVEFVVMRRQKAPAERESDAVSR